MLETMANLFTCGILIWSLMLVLGKAYTVFVETFSEQIEEFQEEMAELVRPFHNVC